MMMTPLLVRLNGRHRGVISPAAEPLAHDFSCKENNGGGERSEEAEEEAEEEDKAIKKRARRRTSFVLEMAVGRASDRASEN